MSNYYYHYISIFINGRRLVDNYSKPSLVFKNGLKPTKHNKPIRNKNYGVRLNNLRGQLVSIKISSTGTGIENIIMNQRIQLKVEKRNRGLNSVSFSFTPTKDDLQIFFIEKSCDGDDKKLCFNIDYKNHYITEEHLPWGDYELKI